MEDHSAVCLRSQSERLSGDGVLEASQGTDTATKLFVQDVTLPCPDGGAWCSLPTVQIIHLSRHRAHALSRHAKPFERAYSQEDTIGGQPDNQVVSKQRGLRWLSSQPKIVEGKKERLALVWAFTSTQYYLQ